MNGSLKRFAIRGALAALACAGLQACPPFDATNDRIDATNKTTNELNDKTGKLLDKSNGLDDKTAQLIQLSTDLDAQTKALLLATSDLKAFTQILVSTTLDLLKETKDLDNKTEQLLIQMGKTNDAIHDQIIAVSKEDMEKDQNTKILEPAPVGMMPGAKIFSENATPQEMLMLVFAQFKSIDEEDPKEDPSNLCPPPVDPKKPDPNCPEGQVKPDVIVDWNHKKLAKYSMAEAISGFVPQDTVASPDGTSPDLDSEIVNKGRYSNTAGSMLLMRGMFLRDVRLDQDLLQHSVENLGMGYEALKFMGYLDWIARRPYIDQIKVVTRGFIDDTGHTGTDNGVNLSFNGPHEFGREAMLKLWKNFKERLTNGLNHLPADIQASDDGKAFLAKVQAGIDAWTDGPGQGSAPQTPVQNPAPSPAPTPALK